MEHLSARLALVLSSMAFFGLNVSAADTRVSPPAGFEPNKGQFTLVNGESAPFILLKAEGHGLSTYVTSSGLSYVFTKHLKEEQDKPGQRSNQAKERMSVRNEMAWAHMRLEGASIRNENIVLEQEGSARYDYYPTHHPEGITGIHRYGRVTVRDVYPGIDWVLYTTERGMKYDFIVHPGADASSISMVYSSAKPVTVDGDGSVHIGTELGEITEKPPVAWYKENGAEVTCRFSSTDLDGHRVRIRFELPQALQPGATLVIDPELTWATFTYTESVGSPESIKTKSNGDVVVVGYGGGGSSFPVPFDTLTFSGAYTDLMTGDFLQAFNSSGVLLWSTFYGGIGQTMRLTIDGDDRLLWTGTASADMPTQAGTDGFTGAYFNPTFGGGGADAMIIAFSPTGQRQWATFLGGASATDITTSPTGRILIAGETDGGTMADQPGIGSFAGAYYQTPLDQLGYLLGFEPNGALSWATGFPMHMYTPKLVAFRSTGEFLLAGNAGPGAPTLASGSFSGAMVNDLTGTMDGYIAGFASNGAQLWGTYFEMGDNDLYDEGSLIQGLAVGADDRAILMGSGVAPTFTPLATGLFTGAYQHSAPNGNSSDAYIYGFNAAGQMQWRTQVGGSATTVEYSLTSQQVALDACGNIFAATTIASYSSEPISPPLFSSCGGYLDGVFADGDPNNYYSPDMLLLRFAPNGELTWSTFYGGYWQEQWTPITVSAQGEFYVAGNSEGQGFHTLDAGNGAWYANDSTVTGGGGCFILRFSPTDCEGPGCAPFHATATVELVKCAGNCDGIATVTGVNGIAPYNYLWDDGQTTAIATGLCSGDHTATITDASGNSVSVTTSIAEPLPMDASLYGSASDCLVPSGILSINFVTGGYTGGLGFPAGYHFAWSHSDLDTTYFEGVPPGSYIVTVTDGNGCIAVDTAYVLQISQPTVTASALDSVLTDGESTVLTAEGAIAYTWYPGTGLSCTNCPAPTASPTDTTTYCVIGVDINGCTDTACVQLFATPPAPPIPPTPPCHGVYVPNAFSPDGSGKNDMQCVYGPCIATMDFTIFDRWGRQVFASTDPKICWDGSFEGKALSAGVFVYRLNGTLTDGSVFEQNGNITLMR